jgi:hypothetical protein
MGLMLDADPAAALAPLDDVLDGAGAEATMSPAWESSAVEEEMPAPPGLPSLRRSSSFQNRPASTSSRNWMTPAM